MSEKVKASTKNYWIQILKGTLVAVSVALVLILAFAIVIRFASVPDGFIKPINQVIKIISILFGVFAALKSDNTKGLKKGMIIGALFSLLSYLVFSILALRFSFDWSVVIDLIFASILGALCGLIVVNIRK